MADASALFAHLKQLGMVSRPSEIPDGAVTVLQVATELNGGGQPSQYMRLKANRVLLFEVRRGNMERARWGREWYYWMKEKEAPDGKAKKSATRTKGS